MKLALGASLFVLLSTMAGCAATTEASSSSDAALTSGRPIDGLSSLAVDGNANTVRFDYRTSGGCARHDAKADIDLVKEGAFSHSGKLQVFDVVEGGEDFCEAMISVSGTASLDTLVRSAAAETGADVAGRFIPIALPRLMVSLNASQPSSLPAIGAVMHSVSSLSADQNGQLRFGYAVSGGCAAHTPSARAVLSEGAHGMTVAKIEILDVTTEEDFCEAMLFRQGTANVHELIAAAAAKTGTDLVGHTVLVELPSVGFSLH